jgi:osmotically-inducible protein OsmY
MSIGFIAQLFLIATLFSYAAENDLGDKDITSAIENEMLLDEGVSSHLIDVNTTEGIVTLSSSVDNILAKERAVEIAKSLKGVRSVIDKLEVKPVEQSDYQIRMNVVNALLSDPATDSFEVSVEVDNNIVTLSGTVDSYVEKELCGEIAKGIKGVKDIENDIEVDYKLDRPNYEIKTDIESRLKSDVRVDDGLINVEVDNGEVKLTGTVGSAKEKSQAKWDAWVAGVSSVDASQLEVKWWARDEMIRKDSYLDFVKITAENGCKSSYNKAKSIYNQ